MTARLLTDNLLSTREKILALDIFMTDIRMHWGRRILGRTVKFRGRFIGWDCSRRRRKVCLYLVRSLLKSNDPSAPTFDTCLMMAGRLYFLEPGEDGRWLRAPYRDGGYEDLEQLHCFVPHCYPNCKSAADDWRYSWRETSPGFRLLIRRYLHSPLNRFFYDLD
jgi:hypothetical protein